jgi:hypothetical protein
MRVISGKGWCRRFSCNDTAVVPDVVTQEGIEYVPAFDGPRTLGTVAAFLRAHLGGAA